MDSSGLGGLGGLGGGGLGGSLLSSTKKHDESEHSFDVTAMVDVVSLDELIESDNNPIFLKLDVEGAEWQALKGGQRLIERYEPTIAISIYHQPDDLWELPLYIARLNPRYKLFLRTQGEDGMDVICYATRP